MKTEGEEKVTDSIEGCGGLVWSLCTTEIVDIIGTALLESVEQVGHSIDTSWLKNKDQKAELSQSTCMGNLGDDNLAGEGHKG